MDYQSFRIFADSWGLAALVAVFVIAVLYVLLRGRRHFEEAATIPLRDDTPLTSEPAAVPAAERSKEEPR